MAYDTAEQPGPAPGGETPQTPGTEERASHPDRTLFGVVFIAALVVRLALLPLTGRPEFMYIEYPHLALEMMRGEGLARAAFTVSPLYIYFWEVMLVLFGDRFLPVLVIQAVMGAATCGFVALWANRCFDRRTGLLAGIGAAVYLPFISNDATFVSEGLVLLVNTAALVCLHAARDRRHVPAAILAGTLLGLSGMTRPNIVLMLPVAALFLWWARDTAPRRRLALIAAVLVPAVAGPAAMTVRNWVVSGDPVPVMSDGGIVFYLGNNELDTGLSYVWPRHVNLFKALPGEVDPTHRISREIAEAETGRALRPNEVGDYWTRETLAFVFGHPAEYVALAARKLRYTWSYCEAHDAQTTYEQERALRHWPLLTFGLVAPLGLVGLALGIRRYRDLLPAYGLVATYTVTCVLLNVVARYRLPMLPALLAGAAYAVLSTVRMVRAGYVGRAAATVAGALALVGIVHIPDFHTRTLEADYEASGGIVSHAERLLEEGKLEESRNLWLAVEKDPPTFGLAIKARQMLSGIAYDLGDPDAGDAWARRADGPLLPEPDLRDSPAKEELTRRIEADPDDVEAYNHLGARLWSENRGSEAERCFREVTRRFPGFGPAQYNRAVCLANTGRIAEARRWAAAARRLRPDIPLVHRFLAALAETPEEKETLIRETRLLADAYPDMPGFRLGLALALDADGRHEEAARELDRLKTEAEAP